MEKPRDKPSALGDSFYLAICIYFITHFLMIEKSEFFPSSCKNPKFSFCPRMYKIKWRGKVSPPKVEPWSRRSAQVGYLYLNVKIFTRQTCAGQLHFGVRQSLSYFKVFTLSAYLLRCARRARARKRNDKPHACGCKTKRTNRAKSNNQETQTWE